MRSPQFHALLAVCLCLSSSGGTAGAWEFDLAGSMEWKYEWYSQTGREGFFGRYDVDNGTTTISNLNFWNGGQFDTNIVTGTSAGWSYFNVKLEPQIKVSEAIRLRAKLRLGTYDNPFFQDYHTQDAPGTELAFSEGQWTMFWFTANTPWGTFGVGKRPWLFGNALQYDGSDSTSTESVVLAVPYGPLDIGIGFYPYRFAGASNIAIYSVSDPYDLPQYSTVGGTSVRGQYFSHADKSGGFSKDFLAFVTYWSGAFHVGALGVYGKYHIGPEALLVDSADPLTSRLVPQDSELFHGSAFVKYFNGRFFFNTEAAWLYWTDRWDSAASPIGLPTRRYIEQWRYMVELGAMAGPLKVTLFHAWTPGPDRRNGVFIDRQPAAFVRHPTYDTHLGNHTLFRPYSYLFAYDYGSGLEAYNLTGNGYVRDASVLAVRLDYAIAANMNVHGGFFWAQRTSHGYSWACIGPNETAFNGIAADGNVDFNLNRYPASPNIPDTDLGYEILLGLHWKLLEGLVAHVEFGMWQPGMWFSYACIDRSVAGWNNGSAANLFGTRPDRKIDAIIGGEFALTVQF
ncbi:MAG: hypothetical protein FJ118_12115 [Deltaproteobacteria bacterium]|nr:hypothetical protein [Deltaproteobacteria bacterium]